MPADEVIDDEDLTMGYAELWPPQMSYQPNYIVYLESTGGNRIATMKVLREVGHHLVLEDSKYIVDHLPYKIGDNVAAEIAHRAQDEFEKVGAVVKLIAMTKFCPECKHHGYWDEYACKCERDEGLHGECCPGWGNVEYLKDARNCFFFEEPESVI